MACQKCIEAGQTKTVHFARCGRWDTRVCCKHSYTRGKLNKKQTGHVISEKAIRRKGTPFAQRMIYTPEMDDFILRNYASSKTHDITRGTGQMKRLAKAFANKFKIEHMTPNRIIGRWGRLKRAERERLHNRHEPSLPVLKFMQGWEPDHA
jgi:hypothetical protein